MNIRNIEDKVLLINQLNYRGNKINIYLTTNKNINLYDLEKLCDSVGWVRRPFKKVKIAIEHSF